MRGRSSFVLDRANNTGITHGIDPSPNVLPSHKGLDEHHFLVAPTMVNLEHSYSSEEGGKSTEVPQKQSARQAYSLEAHQTTNSGRSQEKSSKSS